MPSLLRSLPVAVLAATFVPVTAAAGPEPTTPAGAKPKPKPPGKPTAAPAAKPGKVPALLPGQTQTYTASAKGLGAEMTVKAFALQNGLRVYVLEDHSTPAFALHIAYKVGSRDEAPGRTGFAHLFEHMMFKGSENVADGGHFKAVFGAGGQMNAFTTADVTQYYNILPSHYLDQILYLEADRMRSLAVTDENFENQRNAVKEEKAMRFDNVPYVSGLMTFFTEVWAGTGYGHTTIGTEEDLSAAKTADVKAFFDKYYVPNNAAMVIVGDVSFDEVKAGIEKNFSDIPKGPDREAFAPVDHTQTAPLEKRIEDKLAQQPLYMVGWKTVPEDHPDRHALELLMNVLLHGDSSRITRILKDEKKLVVAAVPLPPILGGGRDAGAAFAAFVPVKDTPLAQIKDVVKSEVATLKKKGITRKELQKALNQTSVETVGSLGTNNGRALYIAQGALFQDDPTYVLTDLEKYRSVTTADIKRVANKYLTDNWLVVEIVPAPK